MKTKIEKFLEKFPKDATSWANATDEIRDLSRESRMFLEDLDEVTVEPVDFKACKTPAEWNTRGRESILANFDRMTSSTQRSFYLSNREMFEAAQPKKEWAMRMYDGSVEYFDTNEDMVAHSVEPGVLYKTMGRTKYIVTE
jgi:sugar-specific transcriptional regulator TrmB